MIRIALRHHERLDGSGYPHGLAGAAIDEPSLLCAIADVHTALTDRRAYRNPLDDAGRLEHMRPFVGRHFEPALFQRYEQVMRDGDGSGQPRCTILTLSPGCSVRPRSSPLSSTNSARGSRSTCICRARLSTVSPARTGTSLIRDGFNAAASAADSGRKLRRLCSNAARSARPRPLVSANRKR